MAPTPGDEDYNYFGNKQMPPEDLIPTVVTSTFAFPDHTATVAYLIGCYANPYTSGIYTITKFQDLAAASSAASSISEIAASLSAEGYPLAAMTSQFGPYQSVATTPAQDNSPVNTGLYSTGASSASPTSDSDSKPPQNRHHGPSPGVMAASIIIPLIAIIITIVISLLCIRHYRRKARKAQAVEMAARMAPEMKSVGVGGAAGAGGRETRAYLAPPTIPPLTNTASASTSTSTSTGAGAEPPVILSTTMTTGFYTGIDTSDHISLSDQRSEASHDTFGEEPPPPYRPRSVPPISRETSVRTSTPGRNPSVRSTRCEPHSTTPFVRRSNEVRSPFDDPEEEDEDSVSETSTIRVASSRRDTDQLSDVSDLSYQEEPTRGHSTV